MSRVIYLSTDGLRPDALEQGRTPNFDRVMRRGAYTLRGRSLMPTVSLPCHMTIFHSVPPERHGVVTNHWVPMVRPVPGLVEILNAAGKRCASFYSWEPLRDVSRPFELARSTFIRYENDPEVADRRLVEAALPHIRDGEYDFVFIYLVSVDEVGHDHGWMSERYLEQVEHADELLGSILEHLTGDATLLIHSDHGGHDRYHGTDDPADITIPWMIMGPQVKNGLEIEAEVSLLDTAPTVAHVLGVAAAPAWEGRVVRDIFEAR